jgi:hypothetical protein
MKNNLFPPIVLFIYKRPKHVLKTLESLSKCYGYNDYNFLVFGDGPKNSTETNLVSETREIVVKFLGDKAKYFFAEYNKGLANSVIHGINFTFGQHDKAIIIEDDLIFHPNFLNFMNIALNTYSNDDRISMVSGYMYDVPSLYNYNSQIFLPVISTWGWGTWARAWKLFDSTGSGYKLLNSDKQLRHKFDCNGSYPFSRMLELQMKNKIDSWGIRWYWSLFNKNKLTCFPPNTLVINNGFDSTATHGKGLFTKFASKSFLDSKYTSFNFVENVPIKADENIFILFCDSMYNLNGGIIGKIRDLLKKYVVDIFRKTKG